MATTRQIDAMAELQNAFRILLQNWVLALPTAIASLIGSIFFVLVISAAIAGAIGGGMVTGGRGLGAIFAGAGLLGIIGGIVMLLIFAIANAAVIAAAENVWQGRQPDLGGGISKAIGKLPAIIVAGIVIFILAIPGILTFIFVIGAIWLILLGFFMMYTLPAIVSGSQGAMDAIKASFNLAKTNVAPSAMAFVGIVVVAIIGNVINTIFSHIMIVNFIVAFAVGGLTSAYTALVAVRFYDLLSGAKPAAAPVTTTPT